MKDTEVVWHQAYHWFLSASWLVVQASIAGSFPEHFLPEWWAKRGDLLLEHITEMGEMYHQCG